jgi:hypothetical protein
MIRDISLVLLFIVYNLTLMLMQMLSSKHTEGIMSLVNRKEN